MGQGNMTTDLSYPQKGSSVVGSLENWLRNGPSYDSLERFVTVPKALLRDALNLLVTAYGSAEASANHVRGNNMSEPKYRVGDTVYYWDELGGSSGPLKVTAVRPHLVGAWSYEIIFVRRSLIRTAFLEYELRLSPRDNAR